MDYIKWDDSYSVGINLIDNQHKKLIRILNKVIEHSEMDVRSKVVAEVLTEMTSYASYHFESEEKYLVKLGKEELDLHRKEHQFFLKETAEFCFETMNNKQTLPKEVKVFLRRWLLNHILKSDMKLKNLKIDE
ncbi:MAG: hemerythrin family protein [Melioribacteraceae bacterium]|nr:hemerythrin family protein [Melioribacteraceae bacterium]